MLSNIRITHSFKFSVRHCLHIYQSNSVYTYIPKNACSTMRYSIAVSNGFIEDESNFKWIQKNTRKMAVKNPITLLNPSYSFIILRCPFSRIVSVFLDKFVQNKPVAQRFIKNFFPNIEIESISFQDFVYKICELEKKQLDEHWRPQVDFLIYKQYHRYFAIEDFGQVASILLQDIGLKLYDTRQIAKHHTSEIREQLSTPDPWNLSIKELRKLKNSQSVLPSVQSMFNEELVKKIRLYYKDDIELYSDKFGKENLLFK